MSLYMTDHVAHVRLGLIATYVYYYVYGTVLCVLVLKVDSFKEGDVVRIIDDIAEVHTLQTDHGGWVDDMALVSG